jgi:hypothetical protein
MTKRKIGGQYVPHLRELIEAPAWRALSRPARLVLDRIEIEHMRHGGQDNGKLAVTFDDFVEHGIHRNIIASAIRECVALGLLVITRPGSAGNAEYRAPNRFLLPYLQANTADQKWREIATLEEAEAIAKAAAGSRNRATQKQNPSSTKTRFSVALSATGTSSTKCYQPPEKPSGTKCYYYLDASHLAAPAQGNGADAQHHTRDPAEKSSESDAQAQRCRARATKIQEFIASRRRR